MRLDERYARRLRSLIEEGEQLAVRYKQALRRTDGIGVDEAIAEVAGWNASAANVVQALFPNASAAHRQVYEASSSLASCVAVLTAIEIDIDAGVIAHMADIVRAEVYDDFMQQAEHLLTAAKTPQAGVVASVVFEDTLRKIAQRVGLQDASDLTLDPLIAALAKANTFPQTKASRCRSATQVRNKALHAKWDEYTLDEVRAVVQLTRELVDQHLT